MIHTNDRDTLLRQFHYRLAKEMEWLYGQTADMHDMIEYLLIYSEPFWLKEGKLKASGRMNEMTLTSTMKRIWIQWFTEKFNREPQRSTANRVGNMITNATREFRKDLTGYMKDGMTAKPLKAKEI